MIVRSTEWTASRQTKPAITRPGRCQAWPLLRILYRVYTNYLGITPPTPAQEGQARAVLIGGVLLGCPTLTESYLLRPHESLVLVMSIRLRFRG